MHYTFCGLYVSLLDTSLNPAKPLNRSIFEGEQTRVSSSDSALGGAHCSHWRHLKNTMDQFKISVAMRAVTAITVATCCCVISSAGLCGANTPHKTVSTTFFLYFACILPAIAFGVLNYNNTGGQIGASHTLASRRRV